MLRLRPFAGHTMNKYLNWLKNLTRTVPKAQNSLTRDASLE